MFLLMLLFASSLYGQDNRPVLQFNHSRQNDFTFFSNLDFRYALELGDYSMDLQVHHDNIYNTALEQDNFVQVYLQSSLWQHFKLNEKLEIASWLETDQYFNSRNEKITLYGGLRYRPLDWLSVTPLIGYTWDTRAGINDAGFTPAVRLDIRRDWEDGLSLRSGVFARYKDINPRQQRNIRFFQFWSKRFGDKTLLRGGVEGGSHELDDYQGNSVKRIISDTLMPSLQLSYEFKPGLIWESDNQIMLYQRFFRYKTIGGGQQESNDLLFNGLEINSRQKVSWLGKKMRASANYEFLYASRLYELENDIGLNETEYNRQSDQEKQKDFTKNLHRTGILLQLNPRGRHSQSFRLNSQYLMYDSPSEENFDDRDELTYAGSWEWKARWRRGFFSSLGLSGNYRHYAFLLKEKSQDNYKQRSLRFDFKYGWDITKNLRLTGDNAVYVTYNVKDFSDFNKTDRSTRNLENHLKLAWQPKKELQSSLELYRKEIHQSYLNWEQFSETTLDTNTILTIENRNIYWFQPKGWKSKVFAGLGYKHFNQVKKFKSSMISLENELTGIFLKQINRQTGPVLSLGFAGKGQTGLDFNLWFQTQIRKSRYSRNEDITIFGGTFQEVNLKKRETEFRPYLTLKFNWYFQ